METADAPKGLYVLELDANAFEIGIAVETPECISLVVGASAAVSARVA